MTIRLAASGFALTLTASALVSAQGHFPSDEAIREIARQAGTISGKVGIVIGVLDADGSRRVVSVGDVPYDGRTLFEIGSISKVFTGILLAEMAERGEVRLEQPVAELLPGDVVVPSRNGRQIRLVDYLTFVGLDPEGRLGVVVLSNQIPVLVSGQTPLVTRIGLHLLDARMPVSFAALERPFSLLPVVLALLLVTGVFVAWRQTGASIRRSTLAAAAVTLGLVVWMAATYAAQRSVCSGSRRHRRR